MYVLRYNFTSKDSSKHIPNDQKFARTAFSSLCYKNHYTNVIYYTNHSQVEMLVNWYSQVWAADGEKEEYNVHLILEGGRCNFRICYR